LQIMKSPSLMSRRLVHHNTKHGLERMKNMLIRLMQLMRHQR
jgi:hypothetical protein